MCFTHGFVQFFWIPSAGSMLASCSNTEGGNMVWIHHWTDLKLQLWTWKPIRGHLHEKMLWEQKQKKRTFQFQDLFCDAGHIAFEILWVLNLEHVDYCYATSSHLPENERPPSAWKGAYWSAAALLGDAWSPAQRIGQHWQQNKTDIDWPTHFISLHQESMKCAG